MVGVSIGAENMCRAAEGQRAAATVATTSAARHVSLLFATPDMAPRIADLHAASFEAGWSASELAALLSADTALAFVATVDQAREPCGFVIGRVVVDEAEIVTIGVVPDRQRSGIGGTLLSGFIRAAGNAGARRIVFEVAEDNAAAVSFYTRHGFVPAGRRSGYYVRAAGPAVDAILMARSIG